MKIAVFAATAAIIATQIGCTWWLSQREPLTTLGVALKTETAVSRIECDLNEQKHILLAHWFGQQPDTKWLTKSPCDAITLPGTD